MTVNKLFEDKNNYKLCYIHNNFAYFTNLPLIEQWGDDWDDKCYSDNAGEPYCETNNQIIKIAFDGYSLEEPCDYAYDKYSVEEINSGAIAWLTGYSSKEQRYIAILAGTSIEKFIELIHKVEGEVYIPIYTFINNNYRNS